MKKVILIALVVGVIVLGFAAGRLTGGEPVRNAAIVKRLFPLLPAPPKETAEVSAAPSESKEPSADLVVEVPGDKASVGPVFEVAGRARLNGRAIAVEVTDASGRSLYSGRVAVVGGQGEDYGRFSQSVTLSDPAVREASVSVAFEPAADQPPAEAVVRTVYFSDPDSLMVKIYLSRKTPGTSGSSDPCENVEAVERIVPSKGAVYRSAIAELLKGPTAEEKTAGLYSSLPRGAVLKSVAADAEGIVTADFSKTLEYGVAGSCRISAIRAQITATLNQFPEVRGVVISVGGRTDDVLQP